VIYYITVEWAAARLDGEKKIDGRGVSGAGRFATIVRDKTGLESKRKWQKDVFLVSTRGGHNTRNGSVIC
jgi:hypothetical protein